jgi:hypothetical protein
MRRKPGKLSGFAVLALAAVVIGLAAFAVLEVVNP